MIIVSAFVMFTQNISIPKGTNNDAIATLIAISHGNDGQISSIKDALTGTVREMMLSRHTFQHKYNMIDTITRQLFL